MVLLIVTIIYLTVNVSSAFVINKHAKAVPAYKNDNLVRLHVIANSNSPYDQYIKRYIRDEVLKNVENYKNNNGFTQKEINGIENYANKRLRENELNYSARVCFGDYKFPTRSYGDLTLPAGKYRAVKIILGRGDGSNWWCVLLPPLCLTENKISIDRNKDIKLKLKIAEVLKREGFNFVGLKEKLSIGKKEKLFDLTGSYIY